MQWLYTQKNNVLVKESKCASQDLCASFLFSHINTDPNGRVKCGSDSPNPNPNPGGSGVQCEQCDTQMGALGCTGTKILCQPGEKCALATFTLFGQQQKVSECASDCSMFRLTYQSNDNAKITCGSDVTAAPAVTVPPVVTVPPAEDSCLVCNGATNTPLSCLSRKKCGAGQVCASIIYSAGGVEMIYRNCKDESECPGFRNEYKGFEISKIVCGADPIPTDGTIDGGCYITAKWYLVILSMIVVMWIGNN